jgi:predicted nucleic acid-binding protein
VPAFFTLEFGNILCKKVRRGEISVDESEVMLQTLHALPLHRHADDLLFPLAFELALKPDGASTTAYIWP